MPKRLTCAVCAKPMQGSTTTSLPQGQATCQPCRRVVTRICEVATCGEQVKCRKLCNRHYQQLQAGINPRLSPPKRGNGKCVVCGERINGLNIVKCQAQKWWRHRDCSACGKRHYNSNRATSGRHIYCSDECKPPPKRPTDPYTQLRWRECRNCRHWICRPGSQVYCSTECRAEGSDRACKICGRSEGLVKYKSICGGCKNRRRSSQARKQSRTRRKHRQRARHYGVEYEPINSTKVYERDNWRCGLCHKPVDRSRKWPDQMCASLDLHSSDNRRSGGRG